MNKSPVGEACCIIWVQLNAFLVATERFNVILGFDELISVHSFIFSDLFLLFIIIVFTNLGKPFLYFFDLLCTNPMTHSFFCFESIILAVIIFIYLSPHVLISFLSILDLKFIIFTTVITKYRDLSNHIQI